MERMLGPKRPFYNVLDASIDSEIDVRTGSRLNELFLTLNMILGVFL